MVGNSQTAFSTDKHAGALINASAATDFLLVVDDNEASAHELQFMLEKLGFEIVPATGGEQALRTMAVRTPDLILLKLLMREMDGFELCKRIQENPIWADIPIVFFSESTDKDLLVRALEGGGADFVTQPFDKQELLSRVRTHLMLKTTRDHLKQMAREKEELLGMISHYLQNHLAGMNMSSRLLLEHTQSNGDSRLRLMAQNIWSSSNQMRVFIKSLLANAAADSGFSMNLESIDLSAAVKRALEQYEEASRNKELVVQFVPLNGSAFIRADAAALDQVLDNLISNAVKFSPARKKISVEVQSTPSHLECKIQDEGPGFTEDDKARMFQRYARLSARPTAGEPSTGLGLSIAKKLVQAMAGELICQSCPGQGATFILRCPLDRSNF